MVILTTIAPLRLYFLSHHRAPYSRVIINFTQGVAQLLLVSSFCGVRLFPSISVWLSSHIRSYKSNESETLNCLEVWLVTDDGLCVSKVSAFCLPQKKSPHDMCFLSQTHHIQVWNGIWNDLIWSSSQQSCRQHLCVRPHNEEISTSHCYVTIWTVLPEARAELRWAEQSGAENSLILLAAPMNGPYSVPLKTDRNQQSNTNRLILQSSNAWVTHQSYLVMNISTQILYKAQHRHCASVYVWSHLHTICEHQCLSTCLPISRAV